MIPHILINPSTLPQPPVRSSPPNGCLMDPRVHALNPALLSPPRDQQTVHRCVRHAWTHEKYSINCEKRTSRSIHLPATRMNLPKDSPLPPTLLSLAHPCERCNEGHTRGFGKEGKEREEGRVEECAYNFLFTAIFGSDNLARAFAAKSHTEVLFLKRHCT